MDLPTKWVKVEADLIGSSGVHPNKRWVVAWTGMVVARW